MKCTWKCSLFYQKSFVQKIKFDVEVIEPDADVSNWPKQLLEYDKFSKFSITKNDYNRTKQYQIRHKFLTDKKRLSFKS